MRTSLLDVRHIEVDHRLRLADDTDADWRAVVVLNVHRHTTLHLRRLAPGGGVRTIRYPHGTRLRLVHEGTTP